MGKEKQEYRPRPAIAEILERAWQHIQSVAYKVSLRWCFYRLLQEAVFREKEDYRRFAEMTAEARKREYAGWRWDTFADGTREIVHRGGGFLDAREWLEAIGVQLKCNLSKWENQNNYVQLWFEARAMLGQFEHYTDHIDLIPFGGDCSIDHKNSIILSLEKAAELWPGKPRIVLYFGDFDSKGMAIPEAAVRAIKNKCSADFEFVRCGLNKGDGRRLKLNENLEKPGTYQWEALDDADAGKLIIESVSKYVDVEKFKAIEKQEIIETEKFRKAWKEFIAGYEN